MNGMVSVLGVAAHHALIHGRGFSVPIHTGGTLSAGGAVVVALVIAGAVGIGTLGWWLDRRAKDARSVSPRGSETAQQSQARSTSAAAPQLRRGDVGVVHRRQPADQRGDRDPMV